MIFKKNIFQANLIKWSNKEKIYKELKDINLKGQLILKINIILLIN